jgi:polyhydroxybutyrate depolymerase
MAATLFSWRLFGCGLLTALALLGPAQAAGPQRKPLFTLSDELLNEGLTYLLPYLEQQYAQHFPGPQTDRRQGAITYRCYPGTGNCVGYDATAIHATGPVVGGATTPVPVATLADFCGQQPAACGLSMRRQLTVAGLTRHYVVHVPWRARALAQPAVVFMLHGTSGDGPQFLAHSGWREKADAEGLIAVFPTALRHCFFEDDNGNGVFDPDEIRSPTKWADGMLGQPGTRPLCTDAQRNTLPPEAAAAADHPLADDLAFFRQMVADLTSTFAGDPRRVYVTGFSNGGQMTLRLAREASDLIAAAASNAGGSPGSLFTTPAPRPMSMIYAVGDVDDRYIGETPSAPIPSDRDLGSDPIFLNAIRPFLTVLSLGSEPHRWQAATLFGDAMSVHQYTASTATPAAANQLIAVIIKGLGHSYPNYMPDALWPFFRDQRLP